MKRNLTFVSVLYLTVALIHRCFKDGIATVDPDCRSFSDDVFYLIMT